MVNALAFPSTTHLPLVPFTALHTSTVHQHNRRPHRVITKMTSEVVATQTPPILTGPSEKEKKYDRQLRLWAANGQAALESANILLFNTGSGTVGVETLKNLVLPG